MPTNNSKLLLFVRHGEYSRHSDIFTDDFQAGLTHYGRNQVKQVATEISKFGADTLITSDFLRTAETAEIISNHIGVDPVYDSRYRERSFPDLYGKTRSEIATILSKEDLEMVNNGNSDSVHIEGCETLQESQRRITQAIINTLAQHGRRIIIVSHGGLHSLLCSQVLSGGKLNNRIFSLGLARMSLFEFNCKVLLISLGFLNSDKFPIDYIR